MSKKSTLLKLVLFLSFCIGLVTILQSSWFEFHFRCSTDIAYVRKCNVFIEAKRVHPLFGEYFVSGSGVVISEDGIVLTAKHVLEDAIAVRVTLSDGQTFDINDYYVDDKYDVGFIDLPLNANNYAYLPSTTSLQQGNILYCIGNPRGVLIGRDYKGKVVTPEFIRMALKDTVFILAKMEVIPGCSGGGCYFRGKLIGIVVISAGEYSLIVPADTCYSVLEKWRTAADAVP